LRASRPAASRAEQLNDPSYRLPDSPTIGGSLRVALVDFYFNSWRMVPANIVWGVLLLLILAATLQFLPALLLIAVLALPVAGMFRMAALLTRGAPMGFADFITGMRRFAAPALTLGILSTAVGLVLTANIAFGLSEGSIIGGIFAVLALYAELALALYLVAAWPILVDPVRETMSFRDRLRLAFYVVATRVVRMLGLTLVILVILIVSTVLFAALVTISVAYISLVATRYVLPAADRLEGRPTVPMAS
jgi:hypothetical protein